MWGPFTACANAPYKHAILPISLTQSEILACSKVPFFTHLPSRSLKGQQPVLFGDFLNELTSPEASTFTRGKFSLQNEKSPLNDPQHCDTYASNNVRLKARRVIWNSNACNKRRACHSFAVARDPVWQRLSTSCLLATRCKSTIFENNPKNFAISKLIRNSLIRNFEAKLEGTGAHPGNGARR